MSVASKGGAGGGETPARAAENTTSASYSLDAQSRNGASPAVPAEPTDAEMMSAVQAAIGRAGAPAVRALLKRHDADTASKVAPERRKFVLSELASLGDGRAAARDAQAARDARQVTLTLGRGVNNAHGETRTVALRELPAVLNEHTGAEAWFLLAEFEDDHRKNEKWRRSDGVTLDLDRVAKTDQPLSDQERAGLWQVLQDRLRPTLAYLTERGARVIHVLHEPCFDAARFASVAETLCDRADEALKDSGFVVDRGASTNRSQLMFTPRATVKGRVRQGRASLLGGLVDARELLQAALPSPARSTTPERSSKPAGRTPQLTLAKALDAYRAANPLADVPRNSGPCPACHHAGCFGRLPGTDARWACFSDRHEADSGGVGVRGEKCWHGDQLDLDAHAAGLAPMELLRRDGWLDPGAATDQPHDGAPREGTSPADVLDSMLRRGRVHHLPTGIAALDAATGGGLPNGGRVALLGPPDGGKTALVNQLADHLAQHGVACGMLSVDEEPRDQLTRYMQRRGFTREQCEAVEPVVIAAMRQQIASLPVRFYGPEFTIEEAAADLHVFVQALSAPHAALFVDSIQTVRCAGTAAAAGRYEQITANVAALRAVAERFGFLVVATSEMNRGGYANPDKRVDDMAAGSGSGAIEYQSRLLLTLRSVPGTPDLIELRLTKNKLGPRTRDDEQGIVLRLDRGRQTLTEVAGVLVPDRATVKQTAQSRTSLRDAALLAIVLLEEPGKSAAKVEAGARALKKARNLGGLGHSAFEAARAALGSALLDDGGEHRSRLRLDAAQLTPELLAAIDHFGKGALIDGASRSAIAAARVAETQAAAAGIAASFDGVRGDAGTVLPDLSGAPRGEVRGGRHDEPPRPPRPLRNLPGEVAMTGEECTSPPPVRGAGSVHARSREGRVAELPLSGSTSPAVRNPGKAEGDEDRATALRDLLHGIGGAT